MLRLQGFSEATRSLNHAVLKTSFGCQPFSDAILLPPIFNAVRSRYEYESLVASFNFNATICLFGFKIKTDINLLLIALTLRFDIF